MNKQHAIAMLCGAIVVASAARYWSTPARAQAAPPSPPSIVVNTVVPVVRDVPVVLRANGTVTPTSVVDVHAQTTSTVRQVHIREGQFVKEGQLLFSLDGRAERAGVERAQAQVMRDEAALAGLERRYRRSVELLDKQFIAITAVDTLRSEVDAQRALLRADQAALRAVQVGASYNTIRAPMAGRVGAITVYPGSLVQVSTLLATVTRLDPIAVAFTLPESTVGELLAAQQRGAVAVQANKRTGKLSFIDNSVDPAAGTIRVKAVFENGDAGMWPGQYVDARVAVRTLHGAVVIPQAAMITNPTGSFVYVVGPDQTVKQVPVKRLHAFGSSAAVTGLAGGETIVTEGKQNLKPGARIKAGQG
ncbi:efflux RND transporter periplasmic adaptor subunit [Massilia pseudoviolaceinigra]|uniref:efflux RND transporter periplasmic adaptor subunit n=1 Tax=Massilia pseudoviolaceinigra TaxID=3057165 RepID=UPI0027969A26|nr:efflux RND transporter periplasmic adaptor subunit [Massilia sp. CCM 9206]MDQ1921335.1 efflux RND transporter periplasmic adaptor subunit [Massilia sp. CCM 9206]